jgi:hypothetical protein
VPVNHLVERFPEKVGKPHDEEHTYIEPLKGGPGDADL